MGGKSGRAVVMMTGDEARALRHAVLTMASMSHLVCTLPSILEHLYRFLAERRSRVNLSHTF